MGLLQNFISRSKTKSPRDDTFDDDFNPLSLASTPFISRPPPLDAKVEQELRKACAVILSDLKPSGYDVEDTRMRSDMLLEEAEREGSHYSQASRKAPASRFSNPSDLSAASQMHSAQRPKKPMDPPRESVRLSTNTKAQIASLMAPLEAPLAPAPTNAPTSRGDTKLVSAEISSPSLKSPSIPSSKHNLISLQEAQAIRAQSVTSHRREESLVPKSPSALQPRGFNRTESLNSQTARPEFGHSATASKSAIERPAGVPPVPPLSSARVARAESGRLEGDAAAKVMEQKLANGILKDKSDELGRTRTMPAVSGPDGFMKSAQLNGAGRTASLTGQRAGSLTSHTKQPSHGILKDFVRPPSRPGSRGNPVGPALRESRESREKERERQRQRESLSRRGDPEPGDFDSLMSFMRKESQKTPGVEASSSAKHHSPSRASISSTMSKGRAPVIPARISSRTSSMVNTPFPNGISQGSRTNTLRGTTEQPILAIPARGVSSPKSPLRPQTNGVSSEEDDSDSPASPETQQHTVDIVYHSQTDGRQSQSANSEHTGFQSVSSQKDRRGIKKILWRLGGGDMPVRKKIFVPQPFQQSYGGHPEYDENYWSDEESCAAPVVAFGRGW